MKKRGNLAILRTHTKFKQSEPRLTLVIPAFWEAKTGGSPEIRSLRPSWPTRWNPVSTENTQISRAWWRVPVIPATWEAEAGESLEYRRRRLQWVEIPPLQCSLGNRARLHLKNKNKKTKKRLEWHKQLSEGGWKFRSSAASYFPECLQF